jgi:hypothetical protein
MRCWSFREGLKRRKAGEGEGRKGKEYATKCSFVLSSSPPYYLNFSNLTLIRF